MDMILPDITGIQKYAILIKNNKNTRLQSA